MTPIIVADTRPAWCG